MNRRRAFLKGAALFALAGAYAFGREIGDGAKRGERRAIIYGTRYGATRDTAGWIAEGMGGDVALLDIEKLDTEGLAERYDRLVIGSGIWIDGPHKKLLKLLEEQGAALAPKIAAGFVVCGTTDRDEAGRKRIAGYLDRLVAPLPRPPKLQRAFGGRMIIARLDERDRRLLENFYTRIIHKPFKDWDRTDPRGAKAFGKIII